MMAVMPVTPVTPPFVEFFRDLELVSRKLVEVGGEFYVREVRKHIPSGDYVSHSYPLDTLHKLHYVTMR